ncbi:xanthine dehydrogenase family protein subunit M [Microvirga sp. TS319]|uniref:FAD binding domain-containing protein n=1 Tax=Microvirga sp. TS319 TaxID=3241165 RepID=UPI00351A4AAB
MRPFFLETARDANEALRLGACGGEVDAHVDAHVRAPAQYLAGGTNLLDLMKLDVARPERLVNINGLRQDYGSIEAEEGELRLGALVHMSTAADHPIIRQDYRVLSDALWMAASPQLRNMASLAGNVLQRTRCNYFRDTSWGACNKRKPGSGCAAIDGVNRRLAVLGVSEHCIANYPGDFAIALVALGARVDVLGTDGASRSIALEDLHRLPGDTPHIETNLAPGELITGFRIPTGPWTRRSLYLKIRDRASYDFALASAAVALDLAPDATVRTVRIGIGGLVAKPWRSLDAEAVLKGRVLDETSASEAAEAAFASAVVHSETGCKPELGRRTLIRALLEAGRMEM